jgi:hypothetical protein
MRKAVAFACVARDAGADDIFPGGLTTAITGQHMVDIELIAIKGVTAVLACVFIPLKDIVSREFDLLFGKPVKETENNDSRYADMQ